jgi:hypothetical protein
MEGAMAGPLEVVGLLWMKSTMMKLRIPFHDIHSLWHSPKSVDKYDVKTEMEKCKCDEQNMPWSSRTKQLGSK